MSATTWSPLSIRGVSPQGGAWSRTHPPHRQAEPASALCASPPRRLPPSRRHGACLPLPRGSDPAPGNTRSFPAQSRPCLWRLCHGSPVDPALDLPLRLELSGPFNSLPSSRIPGKSQLPWSLSSPPSARTSSPTGAPTGTAPRASAGPAAAVGAPRARSALTFQ